MNHLNLANYSRQHLQVQLDPSARISDDGSPPPPPLSQQRSVMNQTHSFTFGDSSVVEAWWQFYGLRAEEDVLGCSRSLFVFISHLLWWQSRIESCSLQPGCKKPGKCARAWRYLFLWLIIRPNLASAASWTKRRRDFTAIKLGQCFSCHC